MANHLSALKRARQTEKRTARNRANTSRLRGALRELREIIAKGDKQAAEQTYRATASPLDKAIQNGTLHDNTPSRYKSPLAARLPPPQSAPCSDTLAPAATPPPLAPPTPSS